MEVDVFFDPMSLKALQQKLVTTGKATGITVKWLCMDQMRLSIKDAIKFTAPWADGVPGTGMAQKKAGEEAVRKDLDRLFARIDKDRYEFWDAKERVMGKRGKYLKRMQKTGEKMAYNLRTKKTFKIGIDYWQRSDLENLHKKYRNSKGRVLKQNRQFWVKPAHLRRYTRLVQKRVGTLKASWLNAYDYFASQVGMSSKVTGWIRRNRVYGNYSNSMNDNGRGQLVARSTAPHTGAIRRDMINYITSKRNKFIRKYTERRMQQIADQFNGVRTNVQPIRQIAAE